VILRQFLYLDEGLLDDFLSQLAGGLYDEERQRDEHSRERGGKAVGKLGGAGGELARQRGEVSETERTVKLSPAARFDRLYELLLNLPQQAVQELEALDMAIWDQLRRGELVNVEAVIRIPTFTRAMAGASAMQDMLAVMQQLSPGTVDDSTVQVAQQMQAMGALTGDSLAVLAEVAGSPEFKFVCKLKQENILAEMDDLEDEVTVFGKLGRKVRAGDREMLLTMPGMSALNREERRKMTGSQAGKLDAEMWVEHPAAGLTVVAIYR